MAHLVITIGCEYGAKGNQIGRKVAEDLGIKFYDPDHKRSRNTERDYGES